MHSEMQMGGCGGVNETGKTVPTHKKQFARRERRLGAPFVGAGFHARP